MTKANESNARPSGNRIIHGDCVGGCCVCPVAKTILNIGWTVALIFSARVMDAYAAKTEVQE